MSWVAHHAVEQLDVRLTRVLHSGKLRARQTANIWGELLNAEVEQAEALAPNDDPRVWAERLRGETNDLTLVGHLPHLARLASLLLTGDSEHSVIGFHQGGLVGLDRTEAGWIVSIIQPPKST